MRKAKSAFEPFIGCGMNFLYFNLVVCKMLYYCMCCVLFSCLSFIGYGINFLYFNLALCKTLYYCMCCVLFEPLYDP